MKEKTFIALTYLAVVSGGLLHELSNDGAREQFNIYLEDKILEQMVHASRVSTIQITTVCIAVQVC